MELEKCCARPFRRGKYSGDCLVNIDNCVFILPCSECYLHGFGSTQADSRGTLAAEKMLIFFLDEVDLGIRSVGVVVEHDQASNLGIDGKLSYL